MTEPDPPLCILSEDGPLLAVNKPPGILTQGVPQGHLTLESQVRDYIKTTYNKPGNVYLGIPHRLDRPTSGVIVFARNSKAAARLAEQFAERSVKKEYLAVVAGNVLPTEGVLSDWLLKDADRANVSVVPEGTAGAKFAELEYRVLAVHAGGTLLHVVPHTGRMHQIRVQLAHRGWPVLDDAQYGLQYDPPSSSIALHAWRLTLKHPIRYDSVMLEAPLPTSWTHGAFPPPDLSRII